MRGCGSDSLLEDDASVVGRVSTLLEAFNATDIVLGVSELSRRTGLPKSTVHRLTRSLTAHGFLEREGPGLRLGVRLFEIGHRVARSKRLREAASPFMADLHEATGHTVHLAVLESNEVLYIDIVRSTDAPPLPSYVGGRMPAHATGVGKAILAFSPPEVIDAVCADELAQFTPRTIVAASVLLDELAKVRRLGVALDREESGQGIVCAGCPILSPEGTAVAGLSVSGWVGRTNLQNVAPAVRTAALGLSRTLYHHPGA